MGKPLRCSLGGLRLPFPAGSLPSCLRLSLYLTVALCILNRFVLADTYVFIKDGTVVNHDTQFVADVLVHNDKIEAIGTDLKIPVGAHIIDARGRYVMPGGIDPHTHLDMPFMGTVTSDDFYSGQMAALAGGTTMHIDFAMPVDHDIVKGYEAWKAKAESRAVMDYAFHMAVTQWDGKTSRAMSQLVQQGVNSFKFFMAYKGSLMVSDEALLQGFARCRELGALPQVHAENGDAVAWGQARLLALGITGPEGHALSRPAWLEGEATGRAIRLARLVNVPLYVVHVMAEDAVEEISRAQRNGQRVLGEAVASGLALDESAMWDADFRVAAAHVMSPPIRGAGHRAAVRKALASGVLQMAATDHAVFNTSQKAMGWGDFTRIPNGVNGIEERLHVVWQEMVNSGLLSPSGFVRATSSAAAMAFNLYPRKGHLGVGSDADIIVLDPEVRHVLGVANHHSRVDTNVYEGVEVKGKVEVTISRGRVVYEHGHMHPLAPGSGRLLRLAPHGPLFHGLETLDAAALQLPYGPIPVMRQQPGKAVRSDEL